MMIYLGDWLMDCEWESVFVLGIVFFKGCIRIWVKAWYGAMDLRPFQFHQLGPRGCWVEYEVTAVVLRWSQVYFFQTPEQPPLWKMLSDQICFYCCCSHAASKPDTDFFNFIMTGESFFFIILKIIYLFSLCQ